MKASSVFSVDPFGLGSGSKFYFNVVIVYDQRNSAIRAKTVLDRLMSAFAEQFHFQFDFWRFDVLNLLEAREEASGAAEVADLIIVASQSGEISLVVKQWLEGCVARKIGNPAALVELFDVRFEKGSLQTDMREFLRPFANGVNFFVHEIETPRSLVYSGKLTATSEMVAWSPPGREWGINE